MKVSDVFSSDEVGAFIKKGYSNDEIIAAARARLKEQNAQEAQQEPQDPQPRPALDLGRAASPDANDGFLKKAGRGLEEMALRYAALANAGFNLGLDDRLDKRLSELETKKQAASRAGLSDERKKELDALETRAANARGVWENVKAGAMSALDTVTHPNEWTVQGAAATLGDPLNFLGFGAGAVAGKAAKSAAFKLAAGSAGGAALNTATAGGVAYGETLGRGKSHDEAKKAALASFGGALTLGALTGALGAAPTLAKQYKQQKKAILARRDLSERQKIQAIENIAPTNEEILIDIAMDEKPHPSASGLRLIADLKTSITKYIKTPAQIYDAVIAKNLSPRIAELAKKAYEARDIRILEQYYQDKITAYNEKLAQTAHTDPLKSEAFAPVSMSPELREQTGINNIITVNTGAIATKHIKDGMFKNRQGIVRNADDVLDNPDEIRDGSNPKNLIFSKRFSDEKVGEVGIRKEPDYKIGPVSVNMLVHSNRITKKKKETQAGTITPDTLLLPNALGAPGSTGSSRLLFASQSRANANETKFKSQENLEKNTASAEALTPENAQELAPLAKVSTENLQEPARLDPSAQDLGTKQDLKSAKDLSPDETIKQEAKQAQDLNSPGTPEKSAPAKDPRSAYERFIDASFEKAGEFLERIDPLQKTEFNLIPKKIQRDFGETLQDLYLTQKQISKEAAATLEALEKKSPDDVKLLVRALNGEVAPSEKIKKEYESFRAAIDENAKKLIELGALDPNAAIKDYLKIYYEEHLKEQEAAKLSLARVFGRKNLTWEERRALGMLENASVIADTIKEQKNAIAKANTLKTLAERFGSDEPRENYVRVSDETRGGGLKKWGALAGKYVPNEVFTALNEANIVARHLGVMERYWYPIVDHIKTNVTVKNPPTHIYNVLSNVVLSYLNGDLPALLGVLKMQALEPKKFKALVEKANKYGLNSALDYVEPVKKEAAINSKNPLVLLWKNLYLTADSTTGAALRRVYAYEDEIFKLAGFYKNLRRGFAEKDAFLRASEVYVNYATPLAPGLKILDKSGLSPFLHYVAKSTPATAKVILKNPLKFATLQGALALGGASVYLNKTDDDYKPAWAKDKFNLFGAKEWARLGASAWHLNTARALPGVKFSGLGVDNTLGAVGGFPLGISLILFQGRDPLGRSFERKGDKSYIERLIKLTENYFPPLTLGRYGQRLAGLNVRQDENKDKFTNAEILARAFGVREFATKPAKPAKPAREESLLKKVKIMDKDKFFGKREFFK